MRARPLVYVVGAVLFASGVGLSGQSSLDYPQWRGQHRDGGASGFVESRSWPEALTLRWKVDVGEGYATPLVIGEIVYTFTRRDGYEVMMALNAKTGAEQWRSSYPAATARVARARGCRPSRSRYDRTAS